VQPGVGQPEHSQTLTEVSRYLSGKYYSEVFALPRALSPIFFLAFRFCPVQFSHFCCKYVVPLEVMVHT
jgi:hypothetical protein